MDSLAAIIGGPANTRKVVFPETISVIFEQQQIQKEAEAVLCAYYSEEDFAIIAGNGTWRACIKGI